MRTDAMPLIYATFGYAVNVSAPAQKSQSGAGHELVSFFRFVPQFCLFAGWIPCTCGLQQYFLKEILDR